MMKVSIIASRPHKWMVGSWLIRSSLGTDYSHVSYCFHSSRSDRKFYYECVMAGGVRFTGQTPWNDHNKVVYEKDFFIDDALYGIFLDTAMDYCGVRYGWWQNIGIEIARIFNLAKNIFSNKKDQSNCSELIWLFSHFVGLTIQGKNDGDLVTPKDIVEACKLHES